MADERELGKKLAEIGSSVGNEPDGLSEGVAHGIKRAQRVTWIMGALTVGLWSMVAIGAAAYCYCFMTYVLPMVEYWAKAGPMVREGLGDLYLEELRLMGEATLFGTYVWAGLIVMAALSTVLFTISSRQTTLRQIRANLAEMSENLKKLATNNA